MAASIGPVFALINTGRPLLFVAALYNATKTSDAIVAYLIAVSVISAVSASLLPGGWRRSHQSHSPQ
jgi:hypothetical protein